MSKTLATDTHERFMSVVSSQMLDTHGKPLIGLMWRHQPFPFPHMPLTSQHSQPLIANVPSPEYLWLHACWCPCRARAPYQVSDVGLVSLKASPFSFTPPLSELYYGEKNNKTKTWHLSLFNLAEMQILYLFLTFFLHFVKSCFLKLLLVGM